MHYLDAHTHVHFRVFDEDRSEVMRRAKSSDVKMVTVGTQAETSEVGIKFANYNPGEVWAAVGFHPNHVADRDKWYHDKNEQESPEPEAFDYERLKKAALDPKCVAVGECGLDYFRVADEEFKKKQKEVFIEQISLAREVGKPLMIHCREAFGDVIEILKEHGKDLKPGVIHFFTGNKEDARHLLDLGYSFTVGGVITFTDSYDEVLNYIPSERLLTETDAPYVAPKSWRGKRNEPSYVLETLRVLALKKGIPEEEMKGIVWNNFTNLFDLG